jgi:hypothetical protein
MNSNLDSPLNETHHAFLVLAFYKALLGDQNRNLPVEEGPSALGVFIKAAQTYGEQRGQRMALRALRDGVPALNIAAYLAYGEWEGANPEAFDVTMSAERGVLSEMVRRCPWADTWRRHGFLEVGTIYCPEIDGAILRGFNSKLTLETVSNIAGSGVCRFCFYDSGIAGTDTLFQQVNELKARAKGPVKRDFTYHCGHIWAVFCAVISDVLQDKAQAVIARAAEAVRKEYGDETLNVIRSYEGSDFTRL